MKEFYRVIEFINPNNNIVKDFEKLYDAQQFIIKSELNHFYIKEGKTIHLNGELYIMEMHTNE